MAQGEKFADDAMGLHAPHWIHDRLKPRAGVQLVCNPVVHSSSKCGKAFEQTAQFRRLEEYVSMRNAIDVHLKERAAVF